MKIYFWLLLILLHSCNHKQAVSQKKIQCGSERIDDYLALVKDKPVGVVANQTSLVDGTHLVDSLIGLGVEIKKIFAPEPCAMAGIIMIFRKEPCFLWDPTR